MMTFASLSYEIRCLRSPKTKTSFQIWQETSVDVTVRLFWLKTDWGPPVTAVKGERDCVRALRCSRNKKQIASCCCCSRCCRCCCTLQTAIDRRTWWQAAVDCHLQTDCRRMTDLMTRCSRLQRSTIDRNWCRQIIVSSGFSLCFKLYKLLYSWRSHTSEGIVDFTNDAELCRHCNQSAEESGQSQQDQLHYACRAGRDDSVGAVHSVEHSHTYAWFVKTMNVAQQIFKTILVFFHDFHLKIKVDLEISS